MERSLVLLAALVAAGCYQPSIERCRLACNANQCPDGLTCNTLGRCASAMDDLCSDVPIEDAPPSESTLDNTATVLVRDSSRRPMEGVPVIFADPTGALITEVMTAADGSASAAVPIGSSLTVVRLKGSVYEVSTFVDLWADARVISQFEADPMTNQVTAEWSAAPNGSTGYDVIATCFTGTSTTNLFHMFPSAGDCTRTDVIVMSSPGSPLRTAVSIGDQSPGVIDLRSQTFQSLRSIDTTIMNRPGGAVDLGFGAWVTPALAMVPPLVQGSVPASGSLSFEMPMETGLLAQFAFTLAGAGTTRHYERLDPLVQMYVKNLGTNVVLPFDLTPSTNLATRRVTWQVTLPTGVTPATPNVVVSTLSYSRGTPATTNVTWHLIGRGDRIVNESTTVRAITYPDIPGTNAWEPLATDAASRPIVQSLVVTPDAQTGVRAILEHNRNSLRLFEVPELRTISHSRAL